MKENIPSPLEKCFDWMNSMAQSIATRLHDKINPLPHRTKKLGLLLIGTLMAVICCSLIFTSIQNNETSKSLQIDSIAAPKNILNDQNSERELINTYNRMMFYKKILDHINARPDRKQLLDSLEKVNPGLPDSINSFIETYYSH